MEDCDHFLGNRFQIRFRKPVQKTWNKLNLRNQVKFDKGEGGRDTTLQKFKTNLLFVSEFDDTLLTHFLHKISSMELCILYFPLMQMLFPLRPLDQMF